MKLRYKISGGILAVMALATVSLAVVLSYESTCEPHPGPSGDGPLMQAIVSYCYGSPDVLEFTEVDRPVPADNEVLVKVHAASVNPLDWHYMRGAPYVIRLFAGIGSPNDPRVGVDFSGIVDSVGEDVTLFKPGDEVFGGRSGAFAEYILVPEDRAMVSKPADVSHQHAAATPIAGVTALQALRDSGKLKAGDRVLINGASGGVGTLAVQIAKSYGAEVTGVCSTRNLDMVRSLGADYVIDYKKDDYTKQSKQYDLVLDMVGNHSLLSNRKVLKPNGRLVLVGGEKGNWIAPLKNSIKVPLLSPFVEQEMTTVLAALNKEDLIILADLMQSGQLRPFIGSSYSLEEVSAAIHESEQGHARGKIAIEIN